MPNLNIRRLATAVIIAAAPLGAFAAEASDTEVTVQISAVAGGDYVVPKGKRFEILDVAFDCYAPGSPTVTWVVMFWRTVQDGFVYNNEVPMNILPVSIQGQSRVSGNQLTHVSAPAGSDITISYDGAVQGASCSLFVSGKLIPT